MPDPIETRARSRGINIVDDATAATSDIVLCCRAGPSPFTDNVHTTCADCGAEIMHRPHVPKAVKLCPACGGRRIAAAIEAGDTAVPVTTRAAAAEAFLAHDKPKGSA